MARPKESPSHINDTKIENVKIVPSFIISINAITSLQEMNVKLQKYKCSPQED